MGSEELETTSCLNKNSISLKTAKLYLCSHFPGGSWWNPGCVSCVDTCELSITFVDTCELSIAFKMI